MVESNLKTSLTRRLGNDAATDINIYIAKLPTNTAGYKVLEPDSLSKYEMIYHESIVGTPGGPGYLVCPASNGRGLSLTSTTRLTVAENVKTHGSGVTIIEAPDHYTLNDKASLSLDNTWTGDQTFEGDTTFEQSITVPVYADATARDAAITSPTNGMEVYLTDTGKFYDYTAGAWIARESGGTFPNASDTVAGKVELATEAEVIAGTATGATGAGLVIPNDSTAIVATSAGVADAGKLARLGATGKFNSSLLDADDGQVDTTYTAAESIAAGDPVSMTSTTDEVENFLASRLDQPGAESTFDADTCILINAMNVSEDKVAVLYYSNTDGSPFLTIGTTDVDKVTTWGTPAGVPAATNVFGICKLEDDKIAISYVDGGQGYVRVATIAGTVPTIGAAASISSGASVSTAVCGVDTDKFVVVYGDAGDGGDGKAKVVSVSGTTCTVDDAGVDMFNADVQYLSIAKLDTDKAAVFFSDFGDGDKGKGSVLTIVGTSVFASAVTEFDAGAVTATTCSQLDTDKIILSFQESGVGCQGRVASVTGTTMTYGVVAPIYTANVATPSVVAVSATEAYVVYEGQTGSTAGLNKLSISGTTITAGRRYGFGTSGNVISATSVAKLGEKNRFIICYRDESAGGGLSEAFQDYDNSDAVVGIAQSSVSATDSVVIRSKGIDSNQVGLTPGAAYYCKVEGIETTSVSGVQAGVAKSATELDIGIDKTSGMSKANADTLTSGGDASGLHTHSLSGYQFGSGGFTSAASGATVDYTITHNLGAIPSRMRITAGVNARLPNDISNNHWSMGIYDGTTVKTIYYGSKAVSGTLTPTVAIDSTYILRMKTDDGGTTSSDDLYAEILSMDDTTMEIRATTSGTDIASLPVTILWEAYE